MQRSGLNLEVCNACYSSVCVCVYVCVMCRAYPWGWECGVRQAYMNWINYVMCQLMFKIISCSLADIVTVQNDELYACLGYAMLVLYVRMEWFLY